MRKSILGKIIIFLFFIITTHLSFMGCDLFGEFCDEPVSYEAKFSIRNNTSSSITVKLVTGIIPRADAGYNELTSFPDEAYKLDNGMWSADTGTYCTIEPKSYNYVYNRMPIGELGRKYTSEEYSESRERHNRLRELMLDKLVSFTLTISRGDTVLYRVAGWDIPDEDMEMYHVNDKLWGYYDTKEENYFYQEENGYAHHYPVLYSKLLPDDLKSSSVGSLTYYIDVQPNNISLVKFDLVSMHTRDSDFWKKH